MAENEESKQHHHHHHHSHSQGHHKHKRRKHKDESKNSRRMWWFRTAAIALLVAGACFLCYRGIAKWESKQFAVPKDIQQNHSQTADSVPKIIMADGERYEHRPNMETYLFMGVDVTGTVDSMTTSGNGGQADVQLVLAVDNDNSTWQVLQLNRDALADVPVLGAGSKLIGYQKKQLALAHFYGSGREDSCENNVNAVSRLLWDQTIAGYISLNMDGIGVINDAIGGVEVTITTDFSGIDDTLEQGSDVLLNGEQAVTFLRSRMNVDDGTNLARMSRHRQYLQAMALKLLSLDDKEIVKALSSAEDYIVTNMNSTGVAALAEKLRQYEQLPLLTIDGTATVANGANAYEMDKASLQNVILTLLYQKQEG